MLNLFKKSLSFSRNYPSPFAGTNLGFKEQKQLEKKYEDIDPFLEIMEDSGARLSIMCDGPLKPLRKLPVGSSLQRTQRHLGKPAAFFAQNGLLNTDTAIFFSSFMGYRARLEVSFFQEQLFGFSCYFLDMQTMDQNLIVEALCGQYDVNLTNPGIQKIIDNQGNTLLISNRGSLQVHIFHTDHPLFDQLKNIAVFYNRKTTKQEKELPIFMEATQRVEKAKPVGY
ncbi:MAG: hypothetical protein ACK4VN_06435 [Bacteroidales bacterium]